MSRFNTGNPLGSGSPLDLDDNAKNMDVAVNSSVDTFQDRLGNSRLTWAGIEKAGTGNPAIAVNAAARAESAASSVEQNAEQIAQDAAEQAASAVIAGVDGSVGEAQGYAQQAETARDAAFVSADVYPDVATGRAAVADGEQFQVVEGDEIVRYRRDSVDEGTEVASYPSSGYVKDTRNAFDTACALVSDDEESEYIDLFVTSDRRRRLAGFNKTKGQFEFLGVPSHSDLSQMFNYFASVLANVPWRNLEPLFMSGQGGVLLDPSDMSSLFQDEAGTVPVTSYGQSVALIRDKSGNGNDAILSGVTVELDDEGGIYLRFNGAAVGHLPKGLFRNVPGAFVSVACAFDSLSPNQFPIFASTAATEAFTQLGLGIYQASPFAEAFSRRLVSDPVRSVEIEAIEQGSKTVLSAQFDHSNDILRTFVGGEPSASLTPLNGTGNTADSDSAAVYIGKGPQPTLFTGRIYGLLVRTPVVAEFEQIAADHYLLAKLSNAANTPDPVPPLTEINVVLVAGQSNTDGRVPIADGPEWIKDGKVDDVLVWTGSGISAFDLSKAGKTGNGSSWVASNSINKFSFAHVALKTMAETIPNLVVCQVASGGTPMAPVNNPRGSWCPDYELIPAGTPRLLEDFVARYHGLANYCAANSITMKVVGLLFHQGESDSLHLGAPEAYLGRFTDLVSIVRSATGLPELPIIYGTVPPASLWYSPVVRDAHLAFAASDENAYCRNNDDLTFLADGLHFDAAGCIVFGDWVAATADSIIQA